MPVGVYVSRSLRYSDVFSKKWSRAKATSQETPSHVTQPPLPWKFGSRVAVLKSLLFPAQQSPLGTLWWLSECCSSCSTCCIMCLLTFLSDPSEAEQHLEAVSRQQELRSSCRTAVLWVLKPKQFRGKLKTAYPYTSELFQRWWWYLSYRLLPRPALPLWSWPAICQGNCQSHDDYCTTVLTRV